MVTTDGTVVLPEDSRKYFSQLLLLSANTVLRCTIRRALHVVQQLLLAVFSDAAFNTGRIPADPITAEGEAFPTTTRTVAGIFMQSGFALSAVKQI